MIVVLDTNVWISALHFSRHRGTPTRALEKAISEDIIATCQEIEAEILRVLTEKFKWQPNLAQSALQSILARAIRVQLRGSVKVCRDPNDDIFLECAARSNADFLIAGDKDLLVLGQYKENSNHHSSPIHRPHQIDHAGGKNKATISSRVTQWQMSTQLWTLIG